MDIANVFNAIFSKLQTIKNAKVAKKKLTENNQVNFNNFHIPVLIKLALLYSIIGLSKASL